MLNIGLDTPIRSFGIGRNEKIDVQLMLAMGFELQIRKIISEIRSDRQVLMWTHEPVKLGAISVIPFLSLRMVEMTSVTYLTSIVSCKMICFHSSDDSLQSITFSGFEQERFGFVEICI